MSLFDDLLKQTTPVPAGQSSGQPGGNPPAVDPLASTSNPIIFSESTPMVSVLDVVQPQIEIPAGTAMHITESDNSIIIDESIPDVPAIMMSTAPIENLAPAPIVLETIMETPVIVENSPLFDMSPTPDPIDMSTISANMTHELSVSDLFEMTPAAPVAPVVQKETEAVFHDTKEYIDHAIDEVSDLITSIDAEDAMVLAAEDEHRKQKEYFAELEIADEANHQKHLEERAHAEKMKKYLEKEQGAALKKNEEKETVAA